MAGKHSYDAKAHQKFTEERKALPQEQIFTQKGMHPELNPYGLRFRESCDSDLYPESLAILLGLDVTGSMIDILEQLAKVQFPHLMADTIALGERYPHVSCCAFDDARVPMRHPDGRVHAPLQVGQFEASEGPIDRCLTNISLERGGGNNGAESSDLIFYAAARHTKIDCYLKRGKKGYAFLATDDAHFSHVSRLDVKRIFGEDIDADIPFADIVREASETYHLFVIMPDAHRASMHASTWRKTLGNNVVCLETPEDFSLACASLIAITEGRCEDLDSLGERLLALGKTETQVRRVVGAVASYAASIGRGEKERPVQGAMPPGIKGKGRTKK